MNPPIRGQLALVLHAHLPYVRHPEHERFLEEAWLHEAVAESYLPLLSRMLGWEADGVDWRLTLGVTSTLGSMLDDGLLRLRTRRYLEERRMLAASECDRSVLEPARRRVAEFHLEFYSQSLHLWEAIGGDLCGAWRRLAGSGRLELLGGTATHAVLPLLRGDPVGLTRQLDIGREEHRRRFGSDPQGIWLPECAWSPWLDEVLHRSGVRHLVLETHAVTGAAPRPPAAVFTPVRTPSGIAVFGRDPATARQVWSRHGGYPGDPRYREFHRDLAHDAEWDYVRPFLPDTGVRTFSGLKFHRVTGPTSEKELYVREDALEAVRGHARHFLKSCRSRVERLGSLQGRPPLLTAPYDAELFGHWWFEGPNFLDAVMRGAAGEGIRTITLSEGRDGWPDAPSAIPAESTWGEGGHLGVWLDSSNALLQPQLRQAARRLEQGVAAGAPAGVDPEFYRRAVTQATRELLLAQSSDWPFLIRMGTAREYAMGRFDGHLAAFHRLLDGALGEASPDHPLLLEREAAYPLFAETASGQPAGTIRDR